MWGVILKREVALGVLVQEEISRGNFPGGKVLGSIALEEFNGGQFSKGQLFRGKYPDTINHNAVFFNNCMSYLPPFPI